MKQLVILILLFHSVYAQSQSKVVTTNILPIKIVLRGQLQAIQDVGIGLPTIEYSIDTSKVIIKVGATEYYEMDYVFTAFDIIFELFEVEDFQSNDFFYTPYFEHMGYLETQKEINGVTFNRKFSKRKQPNRGINYLELDSTATVKFTMLSNYLNEISIHLLKDDVNKEAMITARSMSEALKNPEKIYELNIQNKKTTALSSDIGQLVNLRVLDISGTFISQIPPEIEHCIHLKSIIANASQLKEIPSTIGNLKKLRFVNFGHCKLKTLPETFGELEGLWSINLSSNQLQTLPANTVNLKNAILFSIDKNNFNHFPKEVLGLESVENLWLHGNNFTTIPIEIKELKKLSHFLVDADEIQNIDLIKQAIPKVRIINQSK